MSISWRLRPRTPLLLLLTGATACLGMTVVPAVAVTAATPDRAAVPVAEPVWAAVDEGLRRSHDGDRRRVSPSKYAGFHLDLKALQARLDRAPSEDLAGLGARTTPVTISVPAPSGEFVEFAVEQSPVMEPALAAAHPEIATYAGRTTSGSAPASIRLDVTPMGFHASVRGAGASWYVDPTYNGTDQGADALYVSYDGTDLPARSEGLIEPDLAELRREATPDPAPGVGEGQGAVAVQRSYRLALVSDPSYAAYFTSSANPALVDPIVTAEKVTLMNRVNQLYGDDFSIRMLLVAGNDALNFNTSAQFLSANGRCGQLACYTTDDIGCGDVIDTNRYVVGQIIGAENYDIGHIMFGPDGSGGGVAYLGAVGTSIKAGGCTGIEPPTGDGFAIDYVAHEMGHQFAGNHTFNGTGGSCSGANRNGGTSVEPGSGSSVMAYAGICGADDLQPHTDPYFSQRTQTEVAAFTSGSPSSDNEVQSVALSGFGAGESFTISYGGAAGTVTSGTNYTAAGIKAAVEAAEPSAATATVTGYWGRSSALTNGFQITWSGTADIATPTVAAATGAFTSIVGTTDNGGAEDNGGFANPTPTGNHNPVVAAPANRSIPIRTPFSLTGSATDPDGDALVYLWEQNNPGNAVAGSALVSNAKTSGPLFRVFGTYANVSSANTAQYLSAGENLATSSPTRSFPDIAQVVAGSTNAESGSCPTNSSTTALPDGPTLECYSEQLPTLLYLPTTMTFRLTARDLGGANGGSDGGTSYAETVLTLAKDIGPFLVTSQSSPASVTGGTSGTISWSTTTSSLAANVKVSLSTDGGLTYPTVLLESTPNDGSQEVTWPNVATTQARVKVEAIDNYFYDVNNAPITIVPGSGEVPVDTTAPETTITGGPREGRYFLSDALNLRYASEAGATYTCSLGSFSGECPASGLLQQRRPAAGSYEFSVAATDAAGNTDPTPATRRFFVPANDRELTRGSGPWRLRKHGQSFRGTFTTVKRRGAELRYRVSDITALWLVTTTSKRGGAVKVFLGKKKLGTVRTTSNRTRRSVIRPVTTFSSPLSGVVRIRTTNNLRVKIEGLGTEAPFA
ncbi:hypothetical protein BH09ACT12_BH09ACT12_33830 [soil metagenome]